VTHRGGVIVLLGAVALITFAGRCSPEVANISAAERISEALVVSETRAATFIREAHGYVDLGDLQIARVVESNATSSQRIRGTLAELAARWRSEVDSQAILEEALSGTLCSAALDTLRTGEYPTANDLANSLLSSVAGRIVLPEPVQVAQGLIGTLQDIVDTPSATTWQMRLLMYRYQYC
jgi:hypothetical protein